MPRQMPSIRLGGSKKAASSGMKNRAAFAAIVTGGLPEGESFAATPAGGESTSRTSSVPEKCVKSIATSLLVAGRTLNVPPVGALRAAGGADKMRERGMATGAGRDMGATTLETGGGVDERSGSCP